MSHSGYENLTADLLPSGPHLSPEEKARLNETLWAVAAASPRVLDEDEKTRKIHELVQKGAEINATDIRQNTAMHYLAAHGNRRAITYIYNTLGAAASLRARNRSGFCPIHCAADEEELETVKLFLTLDGNLRDLKTKKGETVADLLSIGHGLDDILEPSAPRWEQGASRQADVPPKQHSGRNREGHVLKDMAAHRKGRER